MDSSRPDLVDGFFGKTFTEELRASSPHALDRLTTAGDCEAGASPAVDNLEVCVDVSAQPPRRCFLRTQSRNLLRAIPLQLCLDTPDRVWDFLVTLHAAEVFNDAARRKGSGDGFQLQSTRSSRRRNPARGLLPARRVRKDHRISTRATRFQLAASCPSR